MKGVRGQLRGPLGLLLRALFAVLSVFYGLGVRLRGLCYDLGLRPSHRAAVPVISVGNLTTGGTGKTPMVAFLARALARRGYRVAVLARGYGRIPARRDGGAGGDETRDDEALPEELSADGVKRYANPDRVTAAREAAAAGADVLLLDDGFQHRRLKRDLDLVLVDALDPFSNGHVLPRGLLREPRSALRRADAIVVTRADLVSPEARAELRSELARWAPEKPVFFAAHRPAQLRTLSTGHTHPPEWLRGRAVYGFAGIGNPAAFQRTLEALGANVVRFHAYPDHHVYSARDLRQIDAEAQEFLAKAIVTTEKDAARIDGDPFSLPPTALRIEFEILEGEEALLSRVQRALGRQPVLTPRP